MNLYLCIIWGTRGSYSHTAAAVSAEDRESAIDICCEKHGGRRKTATAWSPGAVEIVGETEIDSGSSLGWTYEE